MFDLVLMVRANNTWHAPKIDVKFLDNAFDRITVRELKRKSSTATDTIVILLPCLLSRPGIVNTAGYFTTLT